MKKDKKRKKEAIPKVTVSDWGPTLHKEEEEEMGTNEDKPAAVEEVPIESLNTSVSIYLPPQLVTEIELASGKLVENLQPQFDELQKCSGRGIIVTGLAPEQSGFDFFSRFFCPKLGINEISNCQGVQIVEGNDAGKASGTLHSFNATLIFQSVPLTTSGTDPVCGSAHCALAPYWAAKFRKDKLVAYQASKRGGKLILQVDENRVLIQGEAVQVMSGILTTE
eukprot:Gb_13045 [translate_table: standard]